MLLSHSQFLIMIIRSGTQAEIPTISARVLRWTE